jgi:glycyl-tRNA synthetase
LIEDYAEKLNIKAIKEIEKAKVRFGDAFNEANLFQLELLSIKLERERDFRAFGRSGNEDLEDVKALSKS